MDLERSSVSSSGSSLSASSSSSAGDAAAADRMELEAAEALADLAHLAMRESAGPDVGGKWGSKGKRAKKKRLKSESPPAHSVPNPVLGSGPNRSDLAADQPVEVEQRGEPICGDVLTNPTKAELDVDLPKRSPGCARNYLSYGSGRSRQNLTEAEKEERRLRRIFANRESARQTIRRRQALCEELTRKAADLAWENEKLKREKELALKEYQSLETTNKHLKAQMAKVIKTEVEESAGDLKSASIKMTTNPTANCSLLLYNQHPLPPVCWPSVIQSPHPVQSHLRPQNALVVPPNISIQANGKLDSLQQQQENPLDISGPRTPLYIVPCPWYFSVPDHRDIQHHSQSSLCFKITHDEASVNNPCNDSSSSKAAVFMENHHCSLPVKVKSEAAASTEVRIVNDLNERPVGFPHDGGGQCARPQPEELILTSVPLSSIAPTISVKNEIGSQSECAISTDVICTKPSQLITALPEKNQDPFKFPSKKLMDAAAAAEARRRRRELTKIKNLHGRQFRINC